ncbi:MAG: AAA family ATPase [Flavipsychrobacter sp.]
MDKSLIKETILYTSLFDYGNPHAKTLFVKLFGKLANCIEIYQVNTEKIYNYITTHYQKEIKQEVNNSEIYANNKKANKTYCLLILKNEILIEIGNDYCEIYYSGEECPLVLELSKALPKCKASRKKPLEINLITTGDHGLTLNSMNVKRTRLDLKLNYDDDFIEVDKLIRDRLNKKKDKGIVLLHGLPGTGKTTYIRYLVGKLKKKMLFVPPNIASQIGNPELIKLLINNPDSILIIEDAESIIMQRQAGETSSVSNLLNISDGLLSDFLNVQIICTFNSAIGSIDEALMRKGRLIAKYEFKKLPIEKAQALSDKHGFNKTIKEPMSIAEVMNQNDKSHQKKAVQIGFRANWQTV